MQYTKFYHKTHELELSEPTVHEINLGALNHDSMVFHKSWTNMGFYSQELTYWQSKHISWNVFLNAKSNSHEIIEPDNFNWEFVDFSR